jgi:SNF2 family DNA or RNA helicase
MKLYPFQQEGLDFAYKHKYTIIGDEMGLGKTVQAIALAQKAKVRALVVCPAFLRKNWKAEFEKFTDLKVKVVKAGSWGYDEFYDVHIISYNFLNTGADIFRFVDLVIADEVHYLKNVRAKRTTKFHTYMIKYRPQYFLGLSGTPIKNRVGEFYSPLMLCSYSKDNLNGIMAKGDYHEFCDEFSYKRVKKIGHRHVVEYYGHRNIPRLKELLKDKYIRRKQKDVIDLPEMIRKTVTLESTFDEDLVLEAWEEFEEGKSNSLAAVKAESALAKAKFTAEYVKHLIEGDDGPVLVFTDHISSAKRIDELINKYTTCGLIYGNIAISHREELFESFQAGNLPVLVATVGTTSVGVTLTASHNVVYNDLPWVPADLWQSEKRIHRIGQGERCISHILVHGNIDALISKAIITKMKTLKEVL